jgi:hypothetical protein
MALGVSESQPGRELSRVLSGGDGIRRDVGEHEFGSAEHGES